MRHDDGTKHPNGCSHTSLRDCWNKSPVEDRASARFRVQQVDPEGDCHSEDQKGKEGLQLANSKVVDKEEQ